MAAIFSDEEITELIKARKVLPENWTNKFKKREYRGSNEYRLNITGEKENKFQIIIRIGSFNKLNFSAVLGVKVPPPHEHN